MVTRAKAVRKSKTKDVADRPHLQDQFRATGTICRFRLGPYGRLGYREAVVDDDTSGPKNKSATSVSPGHYSGSRVPPIDNKPQRGDTSRFLLDYRTHRRLSYPRPSLSTSISVSEVLPCDVPFCGTVSRWLNCSWSSPLSACWWRGCYLPCRRPASLPVECRAAISSNSLA